MGTFIYKPNKVLEALKRNEIPLGMQMYSHDPDLIEIVGYTGFDYVMLDMEHSRVNPETMVMLIRTAEAAGLTPIVRVGETQPLCSFARLSNPGPRALSSPISAMREEARRALDAMRYPPEGKCGNVPPPSGPPTIPRMHGKSTWPIPMTMSCSFPCLKMSKP